MSQANARVGIVMGSRSDLGIMKKAAETLKSLESYVKSYFFSPQNA